MSMSSPAARLEAKANREQLKLRKAQVELQSVVDFVKRSDLPTEIKLRLYAALTNENETIVRDQERLAGMRKAAEVSRGKQWVTFSDD